MTTEAYLFQAIRFERMIRNKMSEIQRYRDLVTSITVENKQDKIQTSGSKDKLGDFASKIVDMENVIGRMKKARETIIKQIEGMEDVDDYQILYSRYIDDDNLFVIKDIIHCSKSQVYRLHDRALAEFESKYGKLYLNSSRKGRNGNKK